MVRITDLANCIRSLSIDSVEHAKSGHPGMPLGMADVATILFSEFLRFNPKDPTWKNRDRLILSAGHGSMLLYSLLYLTGYDKMTLEQIKNFRQLNSLTPGHPEYEITEGVETSTGPLGQGLANAAGFALAEKIYAAKLGSDVIDHFTYVIAGDGCLMEGLSHEAISFIGHLRLNKVVVLFDDNSITIDGKKNLADSDNQAMRFEASGWYVQAIDGHDHEQIRKALLNAQSSDRPSMIACKTIIGYGAPTKAGSEKAHGAALGEEEVRNTKKAYGWDRNEPFYIPDSLLKEWLCIGSRCADEYNDWQKKVSSLSATQKDILDLIDNSKFIPEALSKLTAEYKATISKQNLNESTRKSSGSILELFFKSIPQLLGGSADLSESNCTKPTMAEAITDNNFTGRYIHYGVREHAMASIMNGLAIYGGIIPYGGTFLVFSDYARPAIRLAALMGLRVIYVLTHDSIGVGEDGPTHQPIEHLASFRAMPNVNVMRPADAVETAECWELAIKSVSTPTILSLTRQNVPAVRKEHAAENLSAKGGYIISESNSNIDVTIFATGSELQIAIAAKEILEIENIGTRVVSMPCTELFDKQPSDYITNILCNNSIKVAIEAAVSFGWERYIGGHGIFVGINSFGASAPAKDLYQYFDITVDNVVNKIKERWISG